MATFGLFCLFASLFGCLQAGNFVGKVMVKYNVFTVIEGDSFTMTCSATHEDRRPELQWYFLDIDNDRTNLTGLPSSGSGFTATDTYTKSRAVLANSGDYFCFAKVGEDTDDHKTSFGIPIQVIEEENRPRVRISRKKEKGKKVLVCEVYPRGSGYLTWRRDGNRVKYDNRRLVSKLELPLTSGGEYQCHGNLTLGGYKYFTSTAYTSAATGLSYTMTHTTFLSLILFCFVAFLNL